MPIHDYAYLVVGKCTSRDKLNEILNVSIYSIGEERSYFVHYYQVKPSRTLDPVKEKGAD